MDQIKKSSGEDKVITVDVVTAKNLLNQGHRYLDVRTEDEFNNGHLENSFNIPYMFNTPEGRRINAKFLDQVLSVCSKEDHLVVGCQSGVRSKYAVTALLNEGFKHAHNMGGDTLRGLRMDLRLRNHILQNSNLNSCSCILH